MRQVFSIQQQLANRLFCFADSENRKTKTSLAYLVGSLFERVSHFNKIGRDGAEIFAVQFGVVGHGNLIVNWSMPIGEVLTNELRI